MPIVNDRQATLERLEDLKSLLPGEGPCLSVYVTLSNASTAGRNPNAKQNELRWRECMQSAEEQLSKFGEAGREVLDSVNSWDAIAPQAKEGEQPPSGKAVAVFRSRDIFQVVYLEDEVADEAVFGRQFHVRPLVKHLVRPRSFYLLALSQKNTRLLRCTMHSSEEVALPDATKTDFEDWMHQTKPDHTAVYNAMAAPAQGSAGPSALAPKGSDAEDKDEYLSHFMKQIATGVGEVLKGKTDPLVLCAVEYEQPIYREVNTYPHLASEAVQGAPNGLKAGEMHARAIEALNRGYETRVDEALAEWNHKVGGGGSSRLDDVVVAAHDGRVLTLLVSDSQSPKGFFDPGTHSVKTHVTESSKEDLVNDALVQTILHAGRVLVAPEEKMPNGAPVAAIFRF